MPGAIALKSPGAGAGVRRRVLFEDRGSVTHVVSRTAGGDFLFDDEEKEAFVVMMKRSARFAGALP